MKIFKYIKYFDDQEIKSQTIETKYLITINLVMFCLHVLV
jgi:hypothetical protein